MLNCIINNRKQAEIFWGKSGLPRGIHVEYLRLIKPVTLYVSELMIFVDIFEDTVSASFYSILFSDLEATYVSKSRPYLVALFPPHAG